MEYRSLYSSPLGEMVMLSEGRALNYLGFLGQRHGENAGEGAELADLPVFRMTAQWLDVYFSGNIPGFTPPLELRGSEFRRAVWELLAAIPYGAAVTYGDLAGKLSASPDGRRTSARAAGGAVGRNPVSIIVPCHRVLGAGGALTGYAGGVWRKAELLKLEGIEFRR